MNTLRIFLFVIFIAALSYFITVACAQGWGPFEVFFTDMRDLSWRGQFNADFTAYLIMSAVWVAWRHRFSLGGIMLALLCACGGSLILIPYLIVLTFRCKGSLQELLMGASRSGV